MQTFFTSLYSALISIFQSQRPADYGLYKRIYSRSWVGARWA